MRPLRIETTFTLEEIERVIAALTASQEHDLVKKVTRARDIDVRSFEDQKASDEALEELRAERAKLHVLTKRQAECLAAVRAGEGPFYRWGTSWGKPRWERVRNMGGAVRRMAVELVEEGLINRQMQALTEAGLARLDAWEAKHGKIGE